MTIEQTLPKNVYELEIVYPDKVVFIIKSSNGNIKVVEQFIDEETSE